MINLTMITNKRQRRMKKLFTLMVLAGLLMSCHITTQEEPVKDNSKAYEAYGLLTIPMVLGGLAIILALLSRGRGDMNSKAYMAFTCGSVAIILNILIICYALFMFCFNPVFRSTVNEQSRRMYGYTINDMINQSVGDNFDVESYLRGLRR